MRNNNNVLLIISVLVNVFLIAFILGRMSTPNMPPPPFMKDRPGFGMGDRGGPHRPKGFGGRPPKPPFFYLSSIFTPEEMSKNFEEMDKSFEQITLLRKEFSEKLTQGDVSEDEVLKHFSEVDGLMDNVRKKTQKKAAERISEMNDEERESFSKILQQ